MPSKARKPPRRKPKQARSRETMLVILEGAAQVFEARGYAKGTTNHVAKRAGVSVGTLYQYFENKEAVLRAIHEEVAGEDRSGVEALVNSLRGMDSRERLRVGVEYAAARHRRMLSLDPEYYREHHWEYRMGGDLPDVSEESRETGREAVFLVRELLRSEEAELGGSVDVGHAAFLLGRGVSAILRAALEDSPELLQDQSFIDEVVKMMVRYLYPDASGSQHD